MPWRSGTLDATGDAGDIGEPGPGLLDHLRAKGSFEGKGIDLTRSTSMSRLGGAV